MKRWGEIKEEYFENDNIEENQVSISKAMHLKEIFLHNKSLPEKPEGHNLRIRNAVLAQGVEVSNQTDMINTLIDTYSKGMAGAFMPNIDFPNSSSAEFNETKKFVKPIWFIQPSNSDFVQGLSSKKKLEFNKTSLKQALRKSVCGLIKSSGYTDANETTITMMTDLADNFYRNLLLNLEHVMQTKVEPSRSVNVDDLEKCYHQMTGKSLLHIHNHIKNDIYAKNRQEVTQFKSSLNEYNKLLQANNYALQKDYSTLLDPSTQELQKY